MAVPAELFMTAGDTDEFTVTIHDVDLSAATFYRIRMDRPTLGVLEIDGTDIGALAQGKFLIKFALADLEAGVMQPVDIKWSLGVDVLTAQEQLFITVKAAV